MYARYLGTETIRSSSQGNTIMGHTLNIVARQSKCSDFVQILFQDKWPLCNPRQMPIATTWCINGEIFHLGMQPSYL